MRRIITLTVLVSAAALLFTGCMLCDSAQYTLCSGVRAGGHTMTHEEMDMYKAGAGYQLYTPGMRSGSNVRPMVSPGTRGMNMGKAGMGSQMLTPRMHSGARIGPMSTPGACKSPFSGLMPALKFLNPLRWFAPWTAPGGPC